MLFFLKVHQSLKDEKNSSEFFELLQAHSPFVFVLCCGAPFELEEC
jgi:hypothetical protein